MYLLRMLLFCWAGTHYITTSISLPRRRLINAALTTTGTTTWGIIRAAEAAAADEADQQTARKKKKTFVITGASSGIGFAVASELAKRGHQLCLACKSSESASAVAQKLPEGSWIPSSSDVYCDLRNLDTVNTFMDAVVENVPVVDGLLLIAGVDGAPLPPNNNNGQLVVVEPHFQINYLGHALMARRLLPKLRASKGRVITVGSSAILDANLRPNQFVSDDGFQQLLLRNNNPHIAYSNSKALCLLLADELRRREPLLEVAACALPGRCATQIVRYELPQRATQRLTMNEEQLTRQARQLGLRTPAEGAALPLWLADDSPPPSFDDDDDDSRVSFWLDPGVPAQLDASWRTKSNARALWDQTSALLLQANAVVAT
mmetsp:Transcript_4807/g.6950  ORF Transcript_4807/g.6950 Transcript_4807/m.6950 type:complete len:376 (+) Transcript_4807:57-1184(+)|eukprot:CAMPEP_0194236720 /NCGR_PEP_ID=MMETSP0158-20130606/3919_1 /TAXON_ID=33649 /ORGANISM="Thalassionema nitzschioides, Strain L26-B" /LENGTH=375 /DNA_ID=CAMNT_0038970555 /DNA_START=9 /DNA_END=1136 /DNA_ORIENTATION=+